MKISSLLNRAADLAATEPILALFLGAALVVVFIAAYNCPQANTNAKLIWTLYDHACRFLHATVIVALVVASVAALRIYLRQSVSHFQRTHGRITDANYNSVQTIWGPEQQQGELRVEIYTDEEITERIESEDLTKPAILRKRTLRKRATGNPFIAANHQVALRQNSRKKGSALYGGYETDCRFTWQLRNPEAQPHNCTLTFPLPSTTAMYDDLTFTLNGVDVLPQAQIREGALLLNRTVEPNETMDVRLAFKSRGMSHWYFQVQESREIRDFTLTLTLPDLPREKLNYPEGCMTPTKIDQTADRAGSILTYRLDHALSSKGMGVALPELPQPGAATNAVLNETDRAFLLIFAMLLLTLTLAVAEHSVLLPLLISATAAFGYSLLADFSDLLFGFWRTAGAILLPMFVTLIVIAFRKLPRPIATRVAIQLVLFGLVYPCAAGLDPTRQSLYLNLCSLTFLVLLSPSLLSPEDASPRPITTIPATTS
ncbi:MAG TPA: hypothetical protein VM680_19750 [Verrucomicrobiae bacterium]|nr:hypothetical protein [Verrucomicrobiae bacterium]